MGPYLPDHNRGYLGLVRCLLLDEALRDLPVEGGVDDVDDVGEPVLRPPDREGPCSVENASTIRSRASFEVSQRVRTGSELLCRYFNSFLIFTTPTFAKVPYPQCNGTSKPLTTRSEAEK